MKIVGRNIIEAAKRKFPKAANDLDVWVELVSCLSWAGPEDVKRLFSRAVINGNNQIIFNITEQHFILIVGVSYPGGILIVKTFDEAANYYKKAG